MTQRGTRLFRFVERISAVTFLGTESLLRYRLKRTPHIKLAEMAEGQYGRVVGRVTPLDPATTLAAPLTERPCVYYGAMVQHYVPAMGWTRTGTEVRAVPFVIDDGTARAVVYFTDARMLVPVRVVSQLRSGMAPGPRQAALLWRMGKSFGNVVSHSFRFYECVLEVGSTVAIYGAGVREADPDAPPREEYRGEPPTRLRLTSSKRHALLISDAPATIATRR